MNKNTGIIIGVVALVVIVGGVYASKNTKNDTISQDIKGSGIEEKEVTVQDDTTKTDAVIKAGSYEAYSADRIARAETGDVVLFFHASWCPTCRGLNTNIENNLASIPVRVTILKIDYDKETELKQKYGVTYQHTLVQVDKDGNIIKKWSGSSSLNKLLEEIQ